MGFLAEIVAEVRADVARPEYGEGLPGPGASHPASLRQALAERRGGRGVVAEFKRASPGAPDSVRRPWTPTEFVRATDLPIVVAYSCLATRPRFLGGPADLAELAASTPLPVLFKDFVLGAAQVRTARRSGAAAILLVARLDGNAGLEEPLRALAERARSAGLEVLLEFHAEAELNLVDRVPADVFGVNMRDLDTLKFERAAAERTLVKARELGLHPLVGMSGVTSAADGRRLWDLGADALLVGSALARSERPGRFLDDLAAERGGVAR